MTATSAIMITCVTHLWNARHWAREIYWHYLSVLNIIMVSIVKKISSVLMGKLKLLKLKWFVWSFVTLSSCLSRIYSMSMLASPQGGPPWSWSTLLVSHNVPHFICVTKERTAKGMACRCWGDIKTCGFLLEFSLSSFALEGAHCWIVKAVRSTQRRPRSKELRLAKTDCSAPGQPQMPAAPTDNNLMRDRSQNHPTKLLSNSWSTETMR